MEPFEGSAAVVQLETGAEVIELLIRKLEHHVALGEDEKAYLAQIALQVREYEPRETIVHEGDHPSESCLLVTGFACRFKLLPEGKRQILSFHVAGDFIDLHSFLLKQMDHGMAAISKCTIAKVPHRSIQAITEQFPRLTRALWWDVALDGAIFREWMVSLGRRDARAQIAHLLCELLLRLQAVGLVTDNSYELVPTQTDLGDALGLSTVHVNRTLQQLRGEGLIVSEGRRVTIPDVEKLKTAAGFNQAYLAVRSGPASAG